MKAKVMLQHTVVLFVEGKSENAIQEQLSSVTPDEAIACVKAQTGNYVTEDYHKEILCEVADDSDVDLIIK